MGRLAGRGMSCANVDSLDRMRKKIAVQGVVQGVGFRPFVFNLAEKLGLTGWVRNHSGGVDIEVEGLAEAAEQFSTDLTEHAPPLARIESIRVQDAPLCGDERFEIRSSERQEGLYQLISPDIATCPDCLCELFDPNDRRYRYPFINCTNCGPRFTIIADIPYDRPNTTMRAFAMCPDCQREYDDPHNRRFHAQPNACSVCGPRLELVASHNSQFVICNSQFENDALLQSARLLCDGAVLAIKGLGGFHLACDATNASVVRTLRDRKHRPDKPLAVMMATLEEVKQHCRVSPEEENLLLSPQRPIVLLPWLPESTVVAEVAPKQGYLGVMLPYTPLHHILLRDVGCPLVMTSGNLSEEPIAADNEEALRRLAPLADAFVLHNRDIYARYDDSVWFVPTGLPSTGLPPQPIRRARSYAPFPIKLPFKTSLILACGAESKNTFCLTRDEYAFLSPHIGDMENLETLEHFQNTVELYKHFFRIEPAAIAYDLHPNYLATRYAKTQIASVLPNAGKLQGIGVQHHHAHLAACLADNHWRLEDGPVIGVIWDGAGYGEDGQIWGGEWLVGDYKRYRRAAHLEYLPLPGGDVATRHPWRIAAGYLYTLLGQVPSCVAPASITGDQVTLLKRQVDRKLNCPQTSSMGRLFDAVSALLGVCADATYEGQAAMELEWIADGGRSIERKQMTGSIGYLFRVVKDEQSRIVRLREVFSAILDDIENKLPISEIAWRFHRTMACMAVEVCEQIASESRLCTVALGGGCFQNRLLLAMVVPLLKEAGFQVLLHQQAPCNDGGLSLGQAAIAQFRMRNMEYDQCV